MTEFNVEVVTIDKIDKHTHADTLSVAHVFGGYPVVIKTGEYKLGDKAVYVPVDSLVPLGHPLFEFLRDGNRGDTKRVRAKKLRGVFSMGLLVPADAAWSVGDNVQERLGITKWEPVIAPAGGEQEDDPGTLPVFTEIESYRKHTDLIAPGENVVLTEKIHGANARYAWHQGRLWAGSHRTFKRREAGGMWWDAADRYKLEATLRDHLPEKVVYGELYGNVQDLRYGAKASEVMFRAFDVFDLKSGRYLDYADFVQHCLAFGIPMVPEVHYGKWSNDLLLRANGLSLITADHCREGFVVRPVKERWDDTVGRVVLKLVGQDYLLRKEA